METVEEILKPDQFLSSLRGMLTPDQLQKLIAEDSIDTVLLVFTDHYGRFLGKRLDAEFFMERALKKGVGACNYLLTVDMEMAPMSGFEYTNWEKGYGDFHLVPQLETLRHASWLEKTAMVICDVFVDHDQLELLPFAPRSILKKQIEQATQLGLTAKAASELEYYTYHNSYRQAAEQTYQNLTPMGWYIEDYHALQGAREEQFNGAARRHLKWSGVPVENSKGEWGKGQHELNVRYTDVLSMADRHCVFKQCLKELADKMGLAVTFMAKIAEDEAGSSCHLHISLWDDNNNVFVGDKEKNGILASELFYHFLGGWIKHLPELMVFYAPTVNSYKRYQSGSWAPTKLAWSIDNRTAGFRIVGKDNSLRIECRIAGADCNPYLAFAAALASGLDGIQNKIEPPPIYQGDVYAASQLDSIPMSLADAIVLFKQSQFAEQVFGKDVVNHYAHFYQLEWQAYQRAVTDWERKRYFEQI